MTQIVRPVADTYNSGFTNSSGGGSGLYGYIDEVDPDPADFIKSSIDPTGDVYVTSLSGGLVDPMTSVSHVLTVQLQQQISAGEPDEVPVTIRLREGYVNPGSPGTLIHEETITAVFSDPFTYEILLPAAAVALITDLNDLFVEIEAG